MATSTPTNNPQDELARLQPASRFLVLGLAWATVMFVVLGFWLRSKYSGEAMIRTNIVFSIGIVALGLAIWQAFTLWFKNETPEQKVITLTNQRRIFSLLLMGAGLGLLVLAIVLGLGQKPPDRSYTLVADKFAEAFGVLLFGLIAFGSGFLLQQAPKDEEVSPIQFLTAQVPMLKLLQMIVGLVAFGTFCFVAYKYRVYPEYLSWLPELAALLAMSVLCLACLLWLNNSNMNNEFGVRLFVLIFGGTAGLILFLYSLGRAYAWRQDIFLGGIPAWQGDNAWHFWLCAYIQFIALILMFVSFNIARTDIRTNVSLRRLMYGYDTIVQGLLLVEILAVLNVVIYALVPFTYDWTNSRGIYDLADSTKNLVSKLKKETHIVVLMSRSDPVYKDVRNLMDNLKALSTRLQVEYVSPDTDSRDYDDLKKLFPKIVPDSPFASAARGVLIYVGATPKDENHNVPNAFVSEQKFVEDNRRMPKGKRIFKGESEIMKEFKFLIEDRKKRKIYVLQGNDEADINLEQRSEDRRDFRQDLNRTGFATLIEKLTRDNLEVAGLSFTKDLRKQKTTTPVVQVTEGPDKKKEVPSDCETLIVSPGAKPLSFEQVDVIERYMERGGKMLVLLDVIATKDFSKLTNTGMEPLLKQFGVEIQEGYCLCIGPGYAGNLLAIGAQSAGSADSHILARQFSRRVISMPMSARPLRTSDAPGQRFKAQPVLQMPRSQVIIGIVETDTTALSENLNRHLNNLVRADKLEARIPNDPVVVAAAVSEVREGKEGRDEKPRLVVVGDTEFITNGSLNQSPQEALLNYSFAYSALQWLAEKEDIGIQAKESAVYKIPEDVNFGRMIFAPAWLMLLATVGLGVGVWIVRRR
jgi:ABC-type uncharacterized transport system